MKHGKKEKKYKMVSVNYTFDCAKEKRCSFCYLKKEVLSLKLQDKFDQYDMNLIPPDNSLLEKYFARTKQISFAYNGLDYRFLGNLIGTARQWNPRVTINVTTIPEFVDLPIAVYFHRCKVDHVALSISEENKNIAEWKRAAEWLLRPRIKVSANILMTDKMFDLAEGILDQIHKQCTQIHFLRPKFYKTKLSIEERRKRIWYLTQKYTPKAFVDHCFQFELLGIPCTRGKDFVSINPFGMVSPCSFDVNHTANNRIKLKKCPYI